MVQVTPNYRETIENLINHAFFKDNEKRLQIVRELDEKCFDNGKCTNENLVKILDKNEVHMEETLGEDSNSWKEFSAKASKFLKQQPDIEICSSLVQLFSKQVIFVSIAFRYMQHAYRILFIVLTERELEPKKF